LAEAKSAGIPSPELEAKSIFEVIALNLLLNPRTTLYTALLAKNKLLSVVLDELAAISEIEQDIAALSNQSFIVTDASSLLKARLALLQLENTNNNSAISAIASFDSAISSFIDTKLSMNVKQVGAAELTRTSAEAKEDLASHYAAIKELHIDLLRRLYSLAVGIDNFLALPISAVIGMSTVSRIREDIEGIIEDLPNSPTKSVDFANRLFADKAAIRTLSSKPNPFESKLPNESLIRASASAKAEYIAGSSSFPISNTLVVNGVTKVYNYGPNAVVSAPISFPVTGTHFYTTVSSVDYDVDTSGTYANVAALCAAINASTSPVTASPFADRSDRIVISCANPFTIKIFNEATNLNILGLRLGPSSTSLTIEQTCSMLNSWFSAHIVASRTSEDRIKISSVDYGPGTALALTVTGFPTNVVAESSFFNFYASTEALVPGPISLVGTVYPGDTITLNNSSVSVVTIKSYGVEINNPLPTSETTVTYESSVIKCYQAMASNLDEALDKLASSEFKKNLDSVDLLINSVGSQRAELLTKLATLKTIVTDIKNLLLDNATVLPIGAAVQERNILNGIIATLEERKFDRALDMLLRCELQELLLLTSNTASYSGHFLQSASDFVIADGIKKNLARDET
jgi:hypothetical protein